MREARSVGPTGTAGSSACGPTLRRAAAAAAPRQVASELAAAFPHPPGALGDAAAGPLAGLIPDAELRAQVDALRAAAPAAAPVDFAWAGRIKYMIRSRVGPGPAPLGPSESLLDPATGLPKRPA